MKNTDQINIATTSDEPHYWECRGPVAGDCGVEHRTEAAAERHCARAHARARNMLPGRHYSDMRVVRVYR